MDRKERFRVWLHGRCLGFDVFELSDDVLNACEKVGGLDLCVY